MQKPLQWHPAFCSSLQIEWKDESLEFHHEYNLTQKPLQIDVLIIKKKTSKIIKKSIGRIFRKHNIVEFKSPRDYLSVNDYYKVLGYACIYQSNTEKVLQISPEEITISFVSNGYPREMIRWLKCLYRAKEERVYKGIYYLTGLMFPIQVIVIKELSKEENIWLSRLRPGLSAENDLNILAEEYKGKHRNPLYSTCMDAIIRTNQASYKKEGDVMCQALIELFDEWYGEQLKKEVSAIVVEEVAKELAKELEKEAKRVGIITIIELVCKKYRKNKSEDQIVDALEVDASLVHQICQVFKEVSPNEPSEEIYKQWSEMFQTA